MLRSCRHVATVAAVLPLPWRPCTPTRGADSDCVAWRMRNVRIINLTAQITGDHTADSSERDFQGISRFARVLKLCAPALGSASSRLCS